jgi:hypothetical protein
MQFNRDEYAFLSRRGSVPVATRSRRRPVPESEPYPRPVGASPAESGRDRLSAAASRAGHAARNGVGSAQAFRAGVRATWTAFGAGGRDEFGGR